MPYYRRKKGAKSTQKRYNRNRSSMRKSRRYRRKKTAKKPKKAVAGYKRVTRGLATQFQRKLFRGTDATELNLGNVGTASFQVVPISVAYDRGIDMDWSEMRCQRLDILFPKMLEGDAIQLLRQVIPDIQEDPVNGVNSAPDYINTYLRAIRDYKAYFVQPNNRSSDITDFMNMLMHGEVSVESSGSGSVSLGEKVGFNVRHLSKVATVKAVWNPFRQSKKISLQPITCRRDTFTVLDRDRLETHTSTGDLTGNITHNIFHSHWTVEKQFVPMNRMVQFRHKDEGSADFAPAHFFGFLVLPPIRTGRKMEAPSDGGAVSDFAMKLPYSTYLYYEYRGWIGNDPIIADFDQNLIVDGQSTLDEAPGMRINPPTKHFV